ncbi:hypothetical protein RD792_007839 [Penstemon davidsonii]|uniref:CCHC-type domain-containing protein n=1 Tax=Penstemon davidsonii TaxID=160366 RepID=A0ABR0D7G1_9LAMI|nr:hypothetical protein RD792_007839 [Penstemon davidsonii]
MAADEGKMKLEKFDGADFGFWKMQIEDYLYQKNLFLPLQEEKPESMKDDEWKLHDRQALGVIRLTLSRNVAFNIAKEKTTAGLMKALSSMYEKPSASNKVHLMRRLFNLRMIEGASVAQHLNELSTITTQLSSVEIEFDDEVQALLLLSSLPESWNATVTAVSSSSGSNKLKFNDVRDLVLNEEIRRRESGETSTPSALSTKSRDRSINNNRGRSNHRGRSKNGKSRSRNPSNFRNSKTVECWNCGKVGHYKNQCKSAPKNQTAKIEANVASTSTQDDVLISSLESKEESWVLDSGASFHATSQKRLFGEYVSGNLGKVYLGDDQPCDIVGKGTVKIKLNGSEWKLKDVRHIPDLRKNLIFVAKEVMNTHDLAFASRPETRVARRLLYDSKDISVSPYGEYWRKLKSICVLQLLSNKRVHSFEFIREEETALLVIYVYQDIFAGGTDTASATLAWAMTELLRHPIVMNKLQKEIREILRDKHDVTDNDLEKMHYLKAVVKETLRYHTPIPLLAREAREDVKVMGYEVAAGTMILTNAWAIGRDPAYWDEPEKFKPDRFLINSSIDFMGLDFELLPFGAGRRRCPGIAFSMANVELVLANLLQKFEWGLPQGIKPEDLDTTENPGGIIHRKNPLFAVATHCYF